MKQTSNIIFDLAHVLFLPEMTSFKTFTLTPIAPGIEILNRCAEYTDSLGNKHRLFVLSNLDLDSLGKLKEKFPEIFARFEGILVSAMVSYKKPDPRIFSHLLNLYDLKAENSIFIDDKVENVIAARSLGITGILCDNHESVAKELKIYGALE
jgi:FMN phosphatase YigB (HAD superfamily)